MIYRRRRKETMEIVHIVAEETKEAVVENLLKEIFQRMNSHYTVMDLYVDALFIYLSC